MLRAGIIGCGGIAERRHAPVLGKLKGVTLAALTDTSTDRLAELGEHYNVPEDDRHADMDSMLANAELDLVHICTPHDLHVGQAIAALESGAHVLLEKPISTTVDEADRIIAAAEAAGRKVAISHNQLWSSGHRAVRRVVDDGSLGEVFFVRSEGFSARHVSGRGINQDWRTQSGAGGGGPLIDNGYHQVYKAIDIAGPPTRVFARIGRHASDIEVEDTAVVMIEHQGGATTSIQVGWCAPAGSIRAEEIFGSTGQLRVGGESPLRLWTHECSRWDDVELEPEGRDELGFPPLVQEFLDAIVNDTDVPEAMSAAASRQTLAVVVAAYESGQSGQPVEL
ncbi:MAG: Gfo/Idh/MocA family oxidoreductase [Candidatus Latescibacteria bacterium]|jgi:predicted dehydrogenase|nr:Gfo/Idh/MocA family oxidoreductase [Candidatus Latescibacterota bacterium]MEE3262773.1 Gfo/Idh/MocA family oxidoreductase [Candidatus Latescibacterota bacterium]